MSKVEFHWGNSLVVIETNQKEKLESEFAYFKKLNRGGILGEFFRYIRKNNEELQIKFIKMLPANVRM